MQRSGALKSFIEKAAGVPIDLTITDNSKSMLSLRHGHKGDVHVRIHRMFLDAGAAVIQEIANFIKNRRNKTPLTREFIRENHSAIEIPPKRRAVTSSEGKYHNLKLIYEAINEEYFNGQLALDITWGRRQTKTVYRKRRLGSYDSTGSLIRIHPALDKSNVPRYFIEYVVYHEMLHAALGIQVKNGRRSIHGREFKRRERLFRDFDRADEFLKYKL
ncbi:MAG: SprT-like domain-containing protein [Nitrospirae bacterium]|nr:SprT-like domain-containing protein [Nitrospirota bacterium]